MGRAKEIIIKTIPSNIGIDFIKKHHYSGKVTNNSALYLGAFLDGILHGVMSFGPSLDKRKIQPLVANTGWNEFIELNRMAFDDHLPRNSESRCLSIAFKLIKKNAPQIKWIISFADGCQCGDGTIYRASGFLLTQIKENKTIWEMNNEIYTGKKQAEKIVHQMTMTSGRNILDNGSSSMKRFIDAGAKRKAGFQLRYIYFLDRDKIKDLTCPILDFSEIDKAGARMYKGVKCPSGVCSNASGVQPEKGSANLTEGLNIDI